MDTATAPLVVFSPQCAELIIHVQVDVPQIYLLNALHLNVLPFFSLFSRTMCMKLFSHKTNNHSLRLLKPHPSVCAHGSPSFSQISCLHLRRWLSSTLLIRLALAWITRYSLGTAYMLSCLLFAIPIFAVNSEGSSLALPWACACTDKLRRNFDPSFVKVGEVQAKWLLFFLASMLAPKEQPM